MTLMNSEVAPIPMEAFQTGAKFDLLCDFDLQ